MLYTSQNVRVWNAPEDKGNGIIRVTFADVTLALTLEEASWLAALVGKEIRTVEMDERAAQGEGTVTT